MSAKPTEGGAHRHTQRPSPPKSLTPCFCTEKNLHPVHPPLQNLWDNIPRSALATPGALRSRSGGAGLPRHAVAAARQGTAQKLVFLPGSPMSRGRACVVATSPSDGARLKNAPPQKHKSPASPSPGQLQRESPPGACENPEGARWAQRDRSCVGKSRNGARIAPYTNSYEVHPAPRPPPRVLRGGHDASPGLSKGAGRMTHGNWNGYDGTPCRDEREGGWDWVACSAACDVTHRFCPQTLEFAAPHPPLSASPTSPQADELRSPRGGRLSVAFAELHPPLPCRASPPQGGRSGWGV